MTNELEPDLRFVFEIEVDISDADKASVYSLRMGKDIQGNDAVVSAGVLNYQAREAVFLTISEAIEANEGKTGITLRSVSVRNAD